MSRVIPRQPVPPLSVTTLDHGPFDLARCKPERFTLIVFYRGLHCPVCRGYITELANLAPEFAARGTDVIAVSTDTEERTRQAQTQWELDALKVGYGLSIDTARAWGLFISSAKPGSTEPTLFAEPGVFVVRADGTLYAAIVNTMPFARPHLKDVLTGLDFVIKNDYAARGEA